MIQHDKQKQTQTDTIDAYMHNNSQSRDWEKLVMTLQSVTHHDFDSHHQKPSKLSKTLWPELMKKYDSFKSDSLMAVIVSS